MPKCTGNPEQSGVWVCPYCVPCSSARECYSLRKTLDGVVNRVPCGPPCTYAGFHGRTPADIWTHIEQAHGWDGKDLAQEPPRPLDAFEAPEASPLPRVQRGPSKATRAKARAKRKKKKRRR